MTNYTALAFVACGGATGACLRFLISNWALATFGKGFPFGTLIVNVIGSLLMGVIFALLEQNILNTNPWKQLIGVGLLGALTTFSTFSMDSLLLIQQGELIKAVLNVVINVVVCLIAAWIGTQLIIKS
ncbi:fluoride efflux transporter CrcB [Motilimonas cestriensis]|uniref:Fluoride-specific ion channel FluC n=1 Tax=Motilimonas cestriensis TaxID=2742685 RepID=A0ABS8W9H7_9GAMM|nr:fluoride efflux transporter CrcB [Motilimonas cestriensis]MCE2595666.1 fluoride efflux transporter CrcB [Motilimonas cestriensis]